MNLTRTIFLFSAIAFNATLFSSEEPTDTARRKSSGALVIQSCSNSASPLEANSYESGNSTLSVRSHDSNSTSSSHSPKRESQDTLEIAGELTKAFEKSFSARFQKADTFPDTCDDKADFDKVLVGKLMELAEMMQIKIKAKEAARIEKIQTQAAIAIAKSYYEYPGDPVNILCSLEELKKTELGEFKKSPNSCHCPSQRVTYP